MKIALLAPCALAVLAGCSSNSVKADDSMASILENAKKSQGVTSNEVKSKTAAFKADPNSKPPEPATSGGSGQ